MIPTSWIDFVALNPGRLNDDLNGDDISSSDHPAVDVGKILSHRVTHVGVHCLLVREMNDLYFQWPVSALRAADPACDLAAVMRKQREDGVFVGDEIGVVAFGGPKQNA
jgi:hypothetical protein